MKMKMKMKNNKMFLALVVVAALAMVSVAGVAVLSDDSSAATNTSYVQGDYTLPDGLTSDIFVSGGDSIVTIPAGVTYSGTITFGDRLGVYGSYVYNGLNSLTFSGASDLTITYKNGDMTVDGAYTGSIILGMGTVTMGSSAYTGTIVAGTATVAMVNSYGVKVTYGSAGIITGTVNTGTAPASTVSPAWSWTAGTDAAYSTVTISGTALIGDLFTVSSTVAGSTELIIADEASVSAQNAATYSVAGTTTTTENVSDVTATVDGISTTGITATGLDKIITYALTGMSLGSHSVVINYTVDTVAYTSSAILVVSTTTSTLTSVVTTGAVSSVANATTPANADITVPYTVGSGLTFISASAKDGTDPVTVSTVSTGVLLSNVVVTDNVILTIITKDAKGIYYESKYLVVATNVTTATAVNGIDTLAASGPSATETTADSYTLAIGSDASMTVNGTLSMRTISKTVYGKITNATTADYSGITVNGTIIYDVTSDSPVINVDKNTNAARYNGATVTATSTMPSYTTYYYTTLEIAMKNSANITIYGIMTIGTTILTGNSTSTPVSNIITVAARGVLTIGTEDASAIVTIPTTTSFTISDSNGVVVAYGKLIANGKTTDYYTNVKAAVFTTDGTDGTYTDLATALSEAVADDVITLRGAATISTTAEVITDVSVVGASNTLEIKAGGKLTVNGTVSGLGVVTIDKATTGTSAKAAGQLIINNTFGTTGGMVMNGVLTFGANLGTETTPYTFTNAISATLTTAAAPAIVNVNGILTLTGNFTSTIAGGLQINVTGTLLTATGASTDKVYMTVTGSFEATTATVYGKLTVTGSAIVTGTATITVSALIAGTAGTTMSENVNAVEITGVAIATDGYAVVYGTAAKVELSSSLVYTTLYLNGTVIYSTQYANSGSAPKADLTAPVITGIQFNGWYTAPVDGSIVNSNNAPDIGSSPSAIYAHTSTMTYAITLSYQKGVTYVLDGVDVGSSYSGYITYGAHTLSAQAASGYKGTVTITMTGAILSDGKFTATENVSVTSTGVSEDVVSGGWTITDILLVIMVIIIAIIAVVVILKLMRS